jgi:DeoR family fructose operon transcriptional repressor
MAVAPGTVAFEERLRWLTAKLAADGAVTIADAAGTLDVSEMTIRRDLAELEERGTARRIRGGAKAIGPQSFATRRDTAVRAKSRIAAKLAALIPPSGTVAFDASSTVMRIAADLRAARDLSVLTNGPDTFGALQGQPGVTPLLTGGQLDARTGSLVGPLACRAASQLLVKYVFMSAAAVDADLGPLEATLEEAEVKRAFVAGAGQVVLAVDASKLDNNGTAVSVEWDAVDVLVTELDPGDHRLDRYRSSVEIA